jgi:glycerol-3-phosphate dehydrogenase (NAD+)
VSLHSFVYNLSCGIVARDYFSESTLGVPSPDHFEGDVESLPDAILWKTLFHTKHFQISVVPDVEGVSLCGALKSPSPYWPFLWRQHPQSSLFDITDIVALAAGFIDGLGWGSNTKGPSID